MKLGETLANFLANPFDPNNDGKTSAFELFLALGLVALIAWVWNHTILKTILGD